jgi:uncharacterized protein (TIGR02466 family)
LNLYSIFPTAVARFELGRDYTADETAFFSWQETHNNEGNTTSNERYVLRKEQMTALNEFIKASVDQYLQNIYAPRNDVNLFVTQSWLNYCKPGQWHHKHAHPNSFISGVLYIKASRERDKIFFYRDGYQQIKLPTDNWNLHNSDSWWFEVGAGDLLLFPSHLTHMVPTVKEERVSLSFNTFPVGYVGEETSLTALHLQNTRIA